MVKSRYNILGGESLVAEDEEFWYIEPQTDELNVGGGIGEVT